MTNACRVSSNKRLGELFHNIANMSNCNDKRSSKCLSKKERLEIIRPNPASKRSLAREYNINESVL